MSDLFYNLVRAVGRPIFWLTARPLVRGIDRLGRSGAFIVAANHQSPYDVALLIRHARRKLDFVSVTEVFRKPFVGWFYGSMNAFPLERSRPDAPTVRIILDRLERGRAVAMFPEGRLTRLEDSVVSGGRIRSGIGRIAQRTGAAVIPVAIVNSQVYHRPAAWLPLRRVRYGMMVGEPILPRADMEKGEAAERIEQELRAALIELHAQLTAEMRERGWLP